MSQTTELMQQLAAHQGIIFDLDNTIFSQTEFDHSAFFQIADFIAKKYQLNQQDLVEYFIKHRNSPPPYKGDLFGCCCQEFNLPAEEATTMIAMFRQHKPEKLRLAPHYHMLLTQLLQQNKALFLVTNGIRSIQQEKIDKLQLAQYFKEIVICTEDGEIPLKPNPAAFVYLKQKYACHSWAMVGDLVETDGLFAKNSGMHFIQHHYCGDDQ